MSAVCLAREVGERGHGHARALIDQSLTVASALPLSMNRPSSLSSRLRTLSVWPTSFAMRLAPPMRGSQTLTVCSGEPDATIEPWTLVASE